MRGAFGISNWDEKYLPGDFCQIDEYLALSSYRLPKVLEGFILRIYEKGRFGDL